MRTAATDNMVLASAPFHDRAGTDAGVVYVFRRREAAWAMEKIYPPAEDSCQYFGTVLTLQNDRLVIGAHLKDADARGAMKLYFYRRQNDKWQQEGELIPYFKGAPYQLHITAVAITDKRLAVGSPQNMVALYYETAPGQWAPDTTLRHKDFKFPDQFGRSVALEGDTCIVGAYAENKLGAVYAFQLRDSTWRRYRIASPDGKLGDAFGGRVAMENGRVYISSPNFDLGAETIKKEYGAFYTFRFNGKKYIYQETIAADQPLPNARLGNLMAVHGGRIGTASFPPTNTQEERRSYIYLFFRTKTGQWEERRFHPPELPTRQMVGSAIALGSHYLVLGHPLAPNAKGKPTGAVWVYTRPWE